MFELVSEYAPAGDQPQAIAKLTMRYRRTTTAFLNS